MGDFQSERALILKSKDLYRSLGKTANGLCGCFHERRLGLVDSAAVHRLFTDQEQIAKRAERSEEPHPERARSTHVILAGHSERGPAGEASGGGAAG